MNAPQSPRLAKLVGTLRPLADERGVVSDGFHVNAALEAAGFDRSAMFAAWLAGELDGHTDPGTYGHFAVKLPAD